ncbi:WD40-repeat-containing domain [Phytophthora cactorum]|nr:WD40-repeat-containing domain [Phytophthora cactorum]
MQHFRIRARAKVKTTLKLQDSPSQDAGRTRSCKRNQRAAIGRERALQAAKRAERLTQPVRKSRRLEGKKVEVEPIESIDQFEMEKMRAPRLPRGSSLHVMDAVDGESKAFLGGITADLEEEEELEEDTILEDDDGVNYSLADEDITKAVQERIYSVAFLPRADRVVVACGDKMGHVALWTPPSMKQESSVSPLAVYRPHYTPFDLRAAESSVVYDTGDDAGISSLVAAATAQCYTQVATTELVDSLIDARMARTNLHVHCLFVAASQLRRWTAQCVCGMLAIVLEEEHAAGDLPHYRSINCAYFSPRDGAWLVTVGQDSYIDMFDTSSLTERKPSDKSAITLPQSVRVRHNNVTGRWLTKLHAAWDPKRSNRFVIGCMEQPRRIQIFRAGRRRPVRELKSDNFASVHSINAFHPHLELIAGGNSSGRLALWRGKKTDKDDVKTEMFVSRASEN